MKFIYCMQKHLADDFVAMGLQKIGTCKINGEEVSVFANDPKIMLNKYQKSAVALTNMLYFDTVLVGSNVVKDESVEDQNLEQKCEEIIISDNLRGKRSQLDFYDECGFEETNSELKED